MFEEIRRMTRVTFKTTLSHLAYFSWYHTIRSPAFIILIYLLACVGAYQSLPPDVPVVVNIIVFVILSIIMFSALIVLTFPLGFAVTQISGKNKTIMTEHSIELYEDHFVSEDQYGRSELKWDIVQKLRRTRSFIIIYVSKNSAMMIPRKAFSSDADWHSFYRFVHTHCSAEATG
jgi:hypothetical protein